MAQQWGNVSNGWSEVSRHVGADGVGVSEVGAFCVDYEVCPAACAPRPTPSTRPAA